MTPNWSFFAAAFGLAEVTGDVAQFLVVRQHQERTLKRRLLL